jgi:hypothetical protein
VKESTLDVTQSIGEYLLERRSFLGKAGAASLGAVLAGLGMPAVAGAFGSVPPPTGYSTLLGVCTSGAGTTSYTPGITNTLQAINFAVATTFSPPVAIAQNKQVAGFTLSGVETLSCSSVTDLSGTGVIRYTNGQSSTYTLDSWTATRVLGQCVGVASGLISNGPFNGARVWGFVGRTVNDPQTCASANGVTSAAGVDTLIIAQ